jgi:hypothetical protein
MKKILLTCSLLSTFFIASIDRLEKRIDKIAKPYQAAIDFIVNLDPARPVNDHDVFMFFSKNGLYDKKDVRTLKSRCKIIKRLAQSKKTSPEVQAKIAVLLHDLGRVVQFVQDYAVTYAALITYYEITAHYYYIDEQHEQVVDLLMEQSEKLGLPSMQKRGLYKFVKKIDFDLRRLTALFTQDIISDDLVVKMNQIKRKLGILKSKIIVSKDYKVQHSKTRWLKAFGVLVLLTPCGLLGLFVATCGTSFLGGPIVVLAFPAIVGPFVITYVGITAQELRESTKYSIPVHSTSLFSLFAPFFLLFTWIPRG